VSAEPERRQRLLQMATGLVFVVVAVVLVLIVVNSGNGSGGDTKIEGAGEIDRILAGIPQRGMVLGDPEAPLTLIEFGDLQCPVCAGYAKDILPPIIENQVKNGKAKIEFRNLTIIGAESTPAGAAALAAGDQGRGWNYLELFYRNQGAEENSGYVTDAFMEAIAKAAGVENLAKWRRDRQKLTSEVEKTTEEAERLGYDATPSFAVEGPGAKGLELLGTPESAGAIEAAIEDAA
jgi:protein-disulfide isomerase